MRSFDGFLRLLWLLSCWATEARARSAGGVIEKRAADFPDVPYYNSESASQHLTLWRQGFEPPGSSPLPFDEHIKATVTSSDIVYLFTGDTQHFSPCTVDNAACQRATDSCSNRQETGGAACNKRQAELANKLQQISMAALNRRLGTTVDGRRVIAGLVLNGDLTDFGHGDELARFLLLWTTGEFDKSIRVYPGLGNHDYSNNVGECTLDTCVNRMLRWFRDYVKDTMKLRLDLRSTKQYLVTEDNTGSFAYSWDECSSNTGVDRPACVHFVQMNNYPTYVRNIDGWFVDWKVLSSLNWLSNDLKREGANKSVVLNFHDFDTAFSPADKLQFRNVLEAVVAADPSIRIVAVFFAHIHERVGVKEYWCIGGRRVPLIYSGSVPGNNYVLGHFSPSTRSLKALYALSVEGESVTYVETESIPGEREGRC